ncbi:MAG: polysaccharide deacetylase family protein [Oscillospiraceae bacterium]|nr:polysaccharide deacetylase family protein [Oscillospiraceae bacterium]
MSPHVFYALLAAAVLLAATAPSFLPAYAAPRKLPVYSVQRDDKCVALTFDAAWGNEDTQTLIDILERYHVKATFFVVGFWAEKYPESVKALHDAGHEVMTHSDDHAHFNSLSAAQMADNLKAGCDKVEAITGVRPSLFRPPYGEYNDTVVETAANLGLTSIQWSVDSLDWKELSAGEITRRVTGSIGPGDIVLFHNAALHTPEALPGILEWLLQNGYRPVPVSELLLKGDYEIDHQGRMRPGKSAS